MAELINDAGNWKLQAGGTAELVDVGGVWVFRPVATSSLLTDALAANLEGIYSFNFGDSPLVDRGLNGADLQLWGSNIASEAPSIAGTSGKYTQTAQAGDGFLDTDGTGMAFGEGADFWFEGIFELSAEPDGTGSGIQALFTTDMYAFQGLFYNFNAGGTGVGNLQLRDGMTAILDMPAFDDALLVGVPTAIWVWWDFTAGTIRCYLKQDGIAEVEVSAAVGMAGPDGTKISIFGDGGAHTSAPGSCHWFAVMGSALSAQRRADVVSRLGWA